MMGPRRSVGPLAESSSTQARDLRTVDVLLSEGQIQSRVQELARQIETDFQGKPLTIVAILTGSLILLADLVRKSVGLPKDVVSTVGRSVVE